jgi:signal transduction histidine kinase
MQKIKFEYKFFLIYLLLGGAWILFSDRLLLYFIEDAKVLSELQTIKGWLYVVLTGVLFSVLLRKHLRKMRQVEDEIRKNNQLKSAFLQNMSHEVRTPLNGIVGFCQLLQAKVVDEEKKDKYLNIIKNSSHELLNVVNDILDVSMIETGNLKANLKVFNLNEFIEKIHRSTAPIVKSNIQFKYHLDLEGDAAVIASDDIKLRQVLNNLISNARKYTEEGKIEFGYRREQKQLLFYVKDTGVGIPDHFRANVFDRFSRAQVEITKTVRGTGLGLAICKGNVEVLGGKIWFESEYGKGSIFYFTIPYKNGRIKTQKK